MVTERVRHTDTAGDLLDRLAEAGAPLLVATLDGIEDGSLEARPQPEDGVSAGAEDPRRGRRGPLDRARARRRPAGPRLHPRAGRLDDVRRASGSSSARSAPTRTDPPWPPGVLAVGKSAVHVGTGTVPVRLGEVKAFGKKQMAAADWARGLRVARGARLGSVAAAG